MSNRAARSLPVRAGFRVYERLRAAAPRTAVAPAFEVARQLACEEPGHTLKATKLVNGTFFRLVDQHPLDWRTRAA